MRKLKPWLKSLDDSKLSSSLKEYIENPEYSDVSEETNLKIQERFRNASLSDETENKSFFTRKTVVSFFASAAAVLIAFGLYNILQRNVGGPEEIALRASVSGSVELVRNSESANMDGNYILRVGDTVSTGSSSNCSVEFNKNIVLLMESSTVTLENADESAVEIFLETGKVNIDLNSMQENQTFSVITELAKVTALGTEFYVESTDSNETYIYLSEGKLEIVLSSNENRAVMLEQNSEMIISSTGYQIESPPGDIRSIK